MKKKFAGIVLFLFFCLSAYGAQNIFEISEYGTQDLFAILDEDDTVSQGSVLVMRINGQLSSERFLIHVFDRLYYLNKDNIVLIGIDFEEKPGFYPIAVVDSLNDREVTGFLFSFFRVSEKKFPESESPVKPKQLSKSESEKRKKEGAMIQAALASGNSKDIFMSGSFAFPLKINEKTGEFGTKRFYKEKLVGRHRGTDLKANLGSLVYAINSGKVVLAKKFSLEGNMVILYHGLGIYSMYMHLSKIKVKEGAEVKTGQTIGLSGKTGRVTGPHLHFAVKINSSTVDPLEFIETVNKYLK